MLAIDIRPIREKVFHTEGNRVKEWINIETPDGEILKMVLVRMENKHIRAWFDGDKEKFSIGRVKSPLVESEG